MSAAEFDPYLVELIDTAREVLALGFLTQEEVAQEVAALMEYGYDHPENLEDVEVAVSVAWDIYLEEQETWTTPSDADRLAAAFDELEALGIAVRMNYTCCQSCGTAEITQEAEGTSAHAFVFFHAQDSESILTDQSIHLSYGPLGAGVATMSEDVWEASTVAVACEAVRVLTRHGLTVSWNGHASQRILVDLPDWRKRLPT